MIDGITILNKEVCNTGSIPLHIFFGVCLICASIFVIIIMIRLHMKGASREEKQVITILLIPVILFFTRLTLLTVNYSKNEYTKYEVTISDDVSLKEFNDKYSIIEQRGDIYVIKEK